MAMALDSYTKTKIEENTMKCRSNRSGQCKFKKLYTDDEHIQKILQNDTSKKT